MSLPQRKIKVCCFCESWETGGIESFLTNVLLHMDLSGLEVDIVAARLGKSVFTQPLQEVGVRFFELSGSPRMIITNAILLKRIFRNRDYHILHLNAFHGFSLGYLWMGKWMGIPRRIAHSHNTGLRKSWNISIKQMVHKVSSFFLTRYATDLWACSAAAARFLFSTGELRKRGFQLIPNGIEVERFRFQPEERERTREKLGLTGKFVVGNIGRLCYQKNQEFLLEVFAKLHDKRPDSTLLLIGEGEERPKLEKQAERLGVREAVVFGGVSDRVEELYWVMDVFAFPSRFEGLGIAAVEAQAAGLPVLCSDFVPAEVGMTDLVCFLPLQVQLWADKLLCQNSLLRKDVSGLIKSRGYDRKQVAQTIQKAYLGERVRESAG